MNALGTTRCLNDENVSVSINQTLFIKHLKNTEVDQSAVQRNKTHTRHKIQIKHIKRQ